MKAVITPFNADGAVVAPPSKSYAHRYIIAAFLAGKECEIKNVGLSEDVASTINAVRSLGGDVINAGDDVIIKGRRPVKSAVVDCGESGSTLRFLMPVAAALGITAEFTGRGKLLSRPVSDMADAVLGHGATVVGHRVSGRLICGKYSLNAGVSSQFTSGLMFALSATDGESEIVLTGNAVSKGYTDMTFHVLKEFGVNITRTPAGYKIVGGFNPPKTATVEGDYSGAAFMLCIGALCGRVTVRGLQYPSIQPDGAITDILARFGAEVIADKDRITVKKAELCGVEGIDFENCPDIAQVVCAVAAFAKGKTTITGIERLRIKESDRIAAIINTLKACGIRAEYSDKTLTVYGGVPKGGEFSGGNDHRTVMSAAVIAAAANGRSVIVGAEACAKSYPEFFSDIKRLGGKADVVI